ncbi:unnamed protein product [Trifolium pratense]|uniref:Uncharacterized protein n=1 Tax=Trifolium pratense TaxID=57577 RepID=A0ACB0KKG4_TRIPR|nr:unnamed protein product [Trifolium pratense]
MGYPSIEAAIKLEKKRTDRKLKELDTETEETFRALDLNKLKSCFGFDTFFATDVRRFVDGGIFIGNLRRPIDEVIPKLEKKLSDEAGREVVLWFMEEQKDDITKQVCMVQLKAEMDLQFELTNLSNPFGYLSAIALAVTTFGTVALMSGFFVKPDATFDDYLADVVPLFGGFLFNLRVSEIATRVTAAHMCIFDFFVLAVAAFVAEGSFNGGDNALYIRPQFFYNNPLLSFIQLVIGPYTDDLGNVLPYAVEGVGVPVDPLAFAGLLGMVVTSLSSLPCGRLEGGRIAQAMFQSKHGYIVIFWYIIISWHWWS